MIDYKPAEGFSKPSNDIINYLHSLSWQEVAQLPDHRGNNLRKTISKVVKLNKDNICIGAGISEFINILPDLMKAEFGNNTTNIVVVPTYKPLLEASHKYDSNLVKVYLKEGNAFEWSDELTKKIIQIMNKADRRCVLWLCSPNNPCGTVIPLNIFELLANQPKCILIIDEAFIEYLDDYIDSSAVSLIKKYNNIIVLRTFSKIYSCAGLRIGYAISDKRWINKINKLILYYNTSTIAQRCASLVIKDTGYINNLRIIIREAKNFFYKEIAKINNVKIGSNSQSNLVVLKSSGFDLYNYLLQNRVLTKDLSGLDGMPDGYIRVGLKSLKSSNILIEFLKMTT